MLENDLQDWSRDSTPLKPKGQIAKFPSKPLDKFSGTEKDNIFVQLEVEGDPVPKFEFYKVCEQALKIFPLKYRNDVGFVPPCRHRRG